MSVDYSLNEPNLHINPPLMSIGAPIHFEVMNGSIA